MINSLFTTNTTILKVFFVLVVLCTPLYPTPPKTAPTDNPPLAKEKGEKADKAQKIDKNTNEQNKQEKQNKEEDTQEAAKSEEATGAAEEKTKGKTTEKPKKQMQELKKESEDLARNGPYFAFEYECAAETTECVPNIGIVLYNQYYFGKSQKHGIRISTHLITYLDLDDTFSKKPNLMKLGLDVKYLYDFWRVGDFVFGLNVGLGYQKSFLLDSEKYDSAPNIHESQKAISELKYSFVSVGGIHIRYDFYQLEILSGYPNYLRVNIAYRY